MKPLIVANWKMNPQTLNEAKQLFNSIKKGIRDIKNACPVGSRRLSFGVEVVICPPFLYLPALSVNKLSELQLGAQNCFWGERGAFTGEVAPSMLKNLNCKYVILGHSERRRYFGETDEMINKKIKAVISAKLSPIFCIGETQTGREKGLTKKILSLQIKKGLKEVTKKEIKKIIIAYEPVWAIGTGKACLPTEAGKMGNFIRKIISQIYNKKIAKNIKILYGGSINSQNAALYISEVKLQGLLIGGASLNGGEFTEILKNVGET